MVVSALTVSLATPASAHEIDANSTPEDASDEIPQETYDLMASGEVPMLTGSPEDELALVEEVSEFVELSEESGAIHFDAEAAEASGVDPEHVAELSEVYSEDAMAVAQQNCTGRSNNYTSGVRVYFNVNSCDVATIQGLLSAGAGVSAIAAVIPGPQAAVFAVAAGLVGVGTGWLTHLARKGCGVTLSAPPMWGSSQC